MPNRTIFSFLLACATVFGAMVLMDRSILKLPGSGTAVTTSTTDQPLRQAPVPMVGPRTLLPPTVQGDIAHGTVVKCIVNGKTVYSNETCPAGAKVKAVPMHITAGVVSPVKEDLAELTARRVSSEQAYQQSLPQQVNLPVQSKMAECEELGKYIEWLDGLARQPQSGQMQDWIKGRKAETQSRQYAIHC
jgi:hypothetical protein